eukprot:gb/GFBE01059433.1/.p1 GENE.gb/GFBE01059433.1/~~gb/GFBE01059433.1/.p1  ORF type:complete len:258 (+),score=34.94 gb/GFBE01059433.1/:1-774(+)
MDGKGTSQARSNTSGHSTSTTASASVYKEMPDAETPDDEGPSGLRSKCVQPTVIEDHNNSGFCGPTASLGWCCATPCSKDELAHFSREQYARPEDSGDLPTDVAVAKSICLWQHPPNFSGSWLCVEVTGDLDRFLVDMGLNEAQRLQARESNYGAHQQKQVVNQSGHDFEIRNELKTSVSSSFKANGGVQRTTDPSGRTVLFEPRWEPENGEALLVRTCTAEGDLVVHTRRYFHGDDMVLDITSPSGAVVKRRFIRQ